MPGKQALPAIYGRHVEFNVRPTFSNNRRGRFRDVPKRETGPFRMRAPEIGNAWRFAIMSSLLFMRWNICQYVTSVNVTS
jgi:hypothetical protein